MSYANSSKERPEQLQVGGKGVYCCVPNCKNTLYSSFKVKSGISLFRFPNEKKTEERKKWFNTIKNLRCKDGDDNFKIRKHSRVCEFHFRPEEIKVTLGVGRKTLRPGVFPSIFECCDKTSFPKIQRKPTKKRILVEESSESEFEETKPEYEETEQPSTFFQDESIADTGRTSPIPGNIINCCYHKEQEIKRLTEENKELRANVQELKTKFFNFENLSNKPELFKKFAGIGLKEFKLLYDFLNPGENCENIKMYEPDNPTKPDNVPSSSSKRGRKPKLKAVEQLFLFMTWLKLGLTIHFTAWLFDTPKSTVSRYIITWVNFMYFSLGERNIWPSKKQVQEMMPETFKKAYPSTRCIIDCTELFCQRPSSLAIQSALYSTYKHHATYKGLVGISPSGAITFISQLYEGSISDKDIVARSGILSPELWDEGDSLMADRGFDIQELLNPMKVTLNIPAFLAGRNQFTLAEVKESQSIASVRIHVERAIQRIKKFRQLRNEISLSLHGSINQIWSVSCLLCNFMPPLLVKDYNVQPSNRQEDYVGQWGANKEAPKSIDFSVTT